MCQEWARFEPACQSEIHSCSAMQVEKLVKSQLWCLKNTKGEKKCEGRKEEKKNRKITKFSSQVQSSLQFQRKKENHGVSEHLLLPVS